MICILFANQTNQAMPWGLVGSEPDNRLRCSTGIPDAAYVATDGHLHAAVTTSVSGPRKLSAKFKVTNMFFFIVHAPSCRPVTTSSEGIMANSAD